MAESVGFFTDTTLCIGCKACQVACHQWNNLRAGSGKVSLPMVNGVSLPALSGDSYDNTGGFSDVNWRHVKFIEQPRPGSERVAWLMMSDVCKHCVNAPCLEVCPTSAILRTEFDTVYINEPACNGCRDCVSACPFGVIHMSETRSVAQKCTLCYDRLQNGLQPACSQACPTQSIQFGKLDDLRKRAAARVDQLHKQGLNEASLYGADDKLLGGLNSFYLLLDKPETYGLPSKPKLPSSSVPSGSFWSIAAAFFTMLGMLFAFRERTKSGSNQLSPPTGGAV
ncbi:MAG TPA: 4Fe-4S dicluster domain-containing protein [Gemmataceae bacterium]|nr:4Fe-4S dicluster domain-containing protein [Gemmataceae bacterium]